MSVMLHLVLWHVTGRREEEGEEDGETTKSNLWPPNKFHSEEGRWGRHGGNGRDVDLLGLVLNSVAAENSGLERGQRGRLRAQAKP